MKGIIIAGGFGTRLRPLTYLRPKPLVSVANRPFLEYQVALLRQHGIEDIVFATNYLADQIQAHFGDGSAFGVKMRYALEDTPLGTGGAIRNAADLFPGEAVAVFNGDVLTDFDLSAILDFHRRNQAIATLTLAPALRPHPFGSLILDGNGRVQDWNEPSEEYKKALAAGTAPPQPEGQDWINAGFYVLQPEFIACIPAGTPSSVERDIFPKFLEEKAAVYGYSPGGFWMDVGRSEQLMVALKAILSGAVQTAVEGRAIGPNTTGADEAALLGYTSIGKNCRIGKGSVLENCLLLDNVQIGEKVHLRGVIVDEGAILEDDVAIVQATETAPVPVVAAGSHLRKGTRF